MKEVEILKTLCYTPYFTKEMILKNGISKDCFNTFLEKYKLKIKNVDNKLLFYQNDKNCGCVFFQELMDKNNLNLKETYRIIARFRNQQDLDIFSKKLDVELDNNTIECYFPEKKVINKKKVSRKTKKTKTNNYFKHWKDMPEFITDFHKSDYATINFYFNKNEYDLKMLKDLFEQTITDKTKSIWFPKLMQGEHRNIRVLGGRNAKYPIYVVTKSRQDEYRFSTSNWLSRMAQPHYIVIEPQELELYEKSKINESPYCNILVMDMSYKEKYNCLSDLGNVNSTGPGAARNFCGHHAIDNGFDWCWILDDNSENFDRYWRGRRILSHTPEVFRSLEEFCDRYENIGLAGLNYSKFCVGENVYPPFVFNTRIYSYGLWNLKCPHIWQEGRYNEDTIQSLNILKTKEWCTVQYNCYLGAKVTTQKIKGGNSKEFYDNDDGGTLPKSKMLVDRHPDVSKLVWKFSRWHHEVNYSSFTQDLKIKDEYKYLLEQDENEIKEHDTWIIRIPRDMCLGDNDNRDYLEKEYPKDCEQDITNSNLYL